jgi:hypothetical protein
VAVSPHDATHINAELAHHLGGRNYDLDAAGVDSKLSTGFARWGYIPEIPFY